jgi:hypothetical protein
MLFVFVEEFEFVLIQLVFTPIAVGSVNVTQAFFKALAVAIA